MDFVYICRTGENEELRYSIRSVLHFYPDANIYIFGDKPRWYSGDYTEIEDYGNKFDNINQCYKAICNTNLNNFVLMNDDFYIINKPNNFNYYFDGLLEEKIERHINEYGLSKYARILSDANKKLKAIGISQPLNYDVHTPMFFNREKLSQVVDLSNAPRSMYGNIFNVGGEKIKDIKIYKHTKNIYINGYFLSSEDSSFNKILDLLKSKFPEPSRYESDSLTALSI
jgi:flagellar biosynthesis/type III secretory pathway chaperone